MGSRLSFADEDDVKRSGETSLKLLISFATCGAAAVDGGLGVVSLAVAAFFFPFLLLAMCVVGERKVQVNVSFAFWVVGGWSVFYFLSG